MPYYVAISLRVRFFRFAEQALPKPARKDRDLAVIVVQARSNRPSDVEPAMAWLNEKLKHAHPEIVIEGVA